MIKPKTSTTIWVIAISGAARNKNIKEAPKPIAPTQITALNRYRVSTAIIAAIIINSSKM
jgi:hypothetical protein